MKTTKKLALLIPALAAMCACSGPSQEQTSSEPYSGYDFKIDVFKAKLNLYVFSKTDSTKVWNMSYEKVFDYGYRTCDVYDLGEYFAVYQTGPGVEPWQREWLKSGYYYAVASR